MPFPQLNRERLSFAPLTQRQNKLNAERDLVSPSAARRPLTDHAASVVRETAARIKESRKRGSPVILAFGAHTIKNGLGPVLIHLMESGWFELLATNGAGVIHDWEFAFQGATSEDVRANVARGQFGIWAETGYYLNLAFLIGAFDGYGYGESVGRTILSQSYTVPAREKLTECLRNANSTDTLARAAAAADLLAAMEQFDIEAGSHSLPHPWRSGSVQAAACRLNIPFTAHPMIGHDIIYTHPINNCAAIGRCAQRDFLTFAEQVARLTGGVYLSIGSAVMSPMIFEKSLSMAQNLAIQRGERIRDHFITVVDLADSGWDWSKGEPPADRPEYYLRYCKSFSRMGGEMRYASADNRDFLLALVDELQPAS